MSNYKPHVVTKVDDDYILLRLDQPIPALGQASFSRSVRSCLSDQLEKIKDHGMAEPSDVHILPNEHADANLIRSFGFTVAE